MSDNITSFNDDDLGQISTVGNQINLEINVGTYQSEWLSISYINGIIDSINTTVTSCQNVLSLASTYMQNMIDNGEHVTLPDIPTINFDSISDLEVQSINSNILGYLGARVSTKGKKLNVRSGYGTNNSIVDQINPGEDVKVIGPVDPNTGFVEVEYGDGKRGYVSSDYLKTDTKSSENQSGSTNGKVSLNDANSHLNVRDENGNIIGKLDHDADIEIIDNIPNSKGYIKIKYNGKEAYVYSKYIK